MDRTIRLRSGPRRELRAFADEREMTYSEAVLALTPEPSEETRVTRGHSDYLDINETAYRRLDSLAGEGTAYGDVIEYYLQENADKRRNND